MMFIIKYINRLLEPLIDKRPSVAEILSGALKQDNELNVSVNYIFI